MVAQIPRLRQEVLKRRLLDLFHFSRAAIAGIEIVLEERTKIYFLERIFLLVRDRRTLFRGRLGGQPVAFLLLASDIVEQGDGIFQLFKDRILDHLGIDHVLELKLVEREHGDHLHETRRQNLPLGQLDVQLVLKKHYFSLKKFSVLGSQFSVNPLPLTVRHTGCGKFSFSRTEVDRVGTKGQCAQALVTRSSSQFPILSSQKSGLY